MALGRPSSMPALPRPGPPKLKNWSRSASGTGYEPYPCLIIAALVISQGIDAEYVGATLFMMAMQDGPICGHITCSDILSSCSP
jgi:hypothetical protein